MFCVRWLAKQMFGRLCVCVVPQSCLTLFCDLMECNPPGSSFCGISQARILEWIAISSSRGYSWPRDWTPVSCICRQILYHWATWEACLVGYIYLNAFLTCSIFSLQWIYQDITSLEIEEDLVFLWSLYLMIYMYISYMDLIYFVVG